MARTEKEAETTTEGAAGEQPNARAGMEAAVGAARDAVHSARDALACLVEDVARPGGGAMPSLGWMLRMAREGADGVDPVAAAWARSRDTQARRALLTHLGREEASARCDGALGDAGRHDPACAACGEAMVAALAAAARCPGAADDDAHPAGCAACAAARAAGGAPTLRDLAARAAELVGDRRRAGGAA